MAKLKLNLKYLFIVAGIVLVWRGIWGLADIYLFPQSPILSFSVSIVSGLLLLLVVNWRDGDISEAT